MTNNRREPKVGDSGEPRKDTPASITSVLGSLKFALAVVLLITVACIAGTVLPQGPQVAKYLAKHPEATGRMELLTTLGLTRVFSCWWFIGLLCVLALSLSVCTWRRFKTFRRARGNVRGRVLGSLITHLSILLILAGGVIRGTWGQKGHMELREGQTVDHFVVREGKIQLPFAIHLVDFEVELYGDERGPGGAPDKAGSDDMGTLVVQWPEKELSSEFPVVLNVERAFGADTGPAPAGAFGIKVLRYVPDFAIDVATKEVKSRSEVARNPAIEVAVADAGHTNTYWLFARYPHFNTHGSNGKGAEKIPLQLSYRSRVAADKSGTPAAAVKDYKSTLRVIDGGAAVLEKTIEVNAPLSYRGYTFYQSSYNPEDLTWTLLQVVHDPGVPVVYAGFTLMIVGLTIIFYICPWLDTKKEKSGGAA